MGRVDLPALPVKWPRKTTQIETQVHMFSSWTLVSRDTEAADGGCRSGTACVTSRYRKQSAL